MEQSSPLCTPKDVASKPLPGDLVKFRVERLDGAPPYDIIVPRDAASPGTIVALDALTGVELGRGQVASGGATFFPRDHALRAAGAGVGATARLVWAPSKASLSPLYPLWEVTDGETLCYVDQNGRKWPKLEPAGPG